MEGLFVDAHVNELPPLKSTGSGTLSDDLFALWSPLQTGRFWASIVRSIRTFWPRSCDLPAKLPEVLFDSWKGG
jgi:hypothetical protein